MKKTIGILYEADFEESSFETGCGGSETWVIQISKWFVKNNFHVIVFNHKIQWTITNSQVEYRPISLLQYTCSHYHFDYFIFTRNLGQYYDIVVDANCADKIYIQSHDMFIWADGLYKRPLDWNNENDRNRFNKINKFIALTEFHKKELHTYNHIPYDMIEIIGNGLDSEVYDNIYNNYEKSPKNWTKKTSFDSDHLIFWTSAFGRGGDILVEDIFPLVKSQCPDAKIYICGYADGVPEHIKQTEGVTFLGTISKEEYYKIFFDADCWFLPCVVVEDFGICAAEALMCHCTIVSPFRHGMENVLYPYTNTKMIHSFGEPTTDNYHFGTYHIDKTSDEYKKACQEAASAILNSFIKYNDIDISIKESARLFTIKTHTWQNVINKWKSVFNEK